MKFFPTVASSVVAVSLGAVTGTAFAASPMALAKAHIRDIAAADVPAITSQYASGALFEWIGGPLNGRYVGAARIKGVWTRFAKANGKLGVAITHVDEASNPAGATVTADVVFSGKMHIPVRYVMTYRGGKLVDEIWQIDPKIAKAMS